MSKKIWSKWVDSIFKKEYPYKAFGIFALITYPAYYILWIFSDQSRYESIWFRIIVCLLSIPLIFEDKWPSKLRIYINFYWYGVVMFSLPFMFTYILFKNNFSYNVVLDVFTIVLLTVLLLDFVPLIIVTTLGVFLGWLLFISIDVQAVKSGINYFPVLRSYLFTIFFGAIFAHRKDIVYKEKLQTMKALGATLAHELRTPLGAIKSGIAGFKNYLPELMNGYLLAKKNKLLVTKMRKDHLEILPSILESIDNEANHASNIIEILLTNIKHAEIQKENFQNFSITECVNYALDHYAFISNQRNKISWNSKDMDFIFYGDKLLIVHILYNLLKNALYFIEKAKKGNIEIWLKKNIKYNELRFKDTGLGISRSDLSYIFDKFFTKNTHRGSGIGLSFCKMVMESINGKISCHSVEGEYTEFVLFFPKMEK